jgi:hypothetical protein
MKTVDIVDNPLKIYNLSKFATVDTSLTTVDTVDGFVKGVNDSPFFVNDSLLKNNQYFQLDVNGVKDINVILQKLLNLPGDWSPLDQGVPAAGWLCGLGWVSSEDLE